MLGRPATARPRRELTVDGPEHRSRETETYR
jgi:hypothetical protein